MLRYTRPAPLTLPKWYFAINTVFIVLGLSLVLAYWGIGEFVRHIPPYDYLHLMTSSQKYCFDQSNFSFGWPNLYPASFYTSFCLPYRYFPSVLSLIWLIVPFFVALILAGRRAAVLVYPPLIILLILGQSTWLILPIYWLMAYRADRSPPRWWQGLLLLGMVFKPHLAILGVVYLFYRWHRYRRFWLTALITWIVLLIPGFLLRPTWLLEWLPSGRGFEPVSLGSIAIIPVRLLGIDVNRVIGMNPGVNNQLVIWVFCALTALVLLALLYRRRGMLTAYDWMLVFCFANPLLNDYDLIILLPFIAIYTRRLWLALTAGIASWVYVMMNAYTQGTAGQYNAVLLITTVLLFDRLYRLRSSERIGAVIKW